MAYRPIGNKQLVTKFNSEISARAGLTTRSDFEKFRQDSGYGGNFSNPSERHFSSYQINLRAGEEKINKVWDDFHSGKIGTNAFYNEIIGLFDNNMISLEQAQETIQKFSVEAQSQLTTEVYMPVTPKQINTAMTLGIITPEEQNRMMGGALKSDVSQETRDYFSNELLPNYDKYKAKPESSRIKAVTTKLQKGTWATAKFTAGLSKQTATVGGKLIFRSTKGMALQGLNSQMGGYGSNLALGDIQSSGMKSFQSTLGMTTGFMRNSVRSGRIITSSIQTNVQKQLQAFKDYKYHTVTTSEKAKFNSKVKNAKSGKEKDLQNLKKASQKYAQTHAKDAHEVTHKARVGAATRLVGKGVASGTAKGIAKAGVKSGARTLKNTPKSATKLGKTASHQVSKIASDNLGQTDETLSSLARTSKSTAKLSFKTARRIPTITKQAAKATSTAFKTVRTAITSIANSIRNSITSIFSNSYFWISILLLALIVILILVAAGSCTVTVPELMGGAADDADEDTFEYYSDIETMLDAEAEYSNAESELATYAASLSLKDALKIVDPDNTYGLTTDNTLVSYSYAAPYHNPYNLIAYLCVVYGEDWTINDVQEEWNYDNENSLIHQQYSIEVALGEGLALSGDYSDIQNSLVSVARQQLGVRYVHGGKSPSTGFDCSGLTQYIYKTVLGITLPGDVATKGTNGNANTGQWYCGDTISKGSSYDEFLANLQVGDLVFMNSNSEQDGLPGHVGIYVGDGNFINASTSNGMQVVEESIRGRSFSNYFGARRILGSDWLVGQSSSTGSDSSEDVMWSVKITLVNHGMDATIRNILSGDDLELYLKLCYNYGSSIDGESEIEEYWPRDIYKTHDDEVSEEEFVYEQYTKDFNVDMSTSSYLSGGYGSGYYIDQSTGAMWPLTEKSWVTAGFGSHDAWHTSSSGHKGTDLHATEGEEVYAIYAGQVKQIYTATGKQYDNSTATGGLDDRGHFVIIESVVNIGGTNVVIDITYQHFCESSAGILTVGQQVSQGQVVGHVGTTGHSSGPHLHIELYVNNESTPTNIIRYLFPNYDSA